MNKLNRNYLEDIKEELAFLIHLQDSENTRAVKKAEFTLWLSKSIGNFKSEDSMNIIDLEVDTSYLLKTSPLYRKVYAILSVQFEIPFLKDTLLFIESSLLCFLFAIIIKKENLTYYKEFGDWCAQTDLEIIRKVMLEMAMKRAK